MDAAQLKLDVTDNVTILPRIKIEMLLFRFTATIAKLLESKKFDGQSVKQKTNVSNSELVAIESIELWEILRFLYVT